MSGNENSGRTPKGTKPDKGKNNVITTVIAPEYMEGESLTYWNKVIEILIDRQSYTDADYEALEMLATLYGQWRELSRQLVKEGMTYEAKSDRGGHGRIYEHPAVKTMLSVTKQIESYQRKFGLTPLDRKDIPKTKKPRNSVRDNY